MAVSTFEGLTLGAAVAGTAGFDFISNPAGGGATIVNTLPYRGAQCMQLVTGTSGGICYAERTTSVNVNSTGQVFGRLRFRVPVLPPDSTGMRIILVADSGGSFRAEVRLIDSGKLQLRNAAGTVLATSTLTLTANTYADVGLAVLVFSTSVGQMEMRIWDASGNVAETLTSAASQNTTGAGGLCKLQVGAVRSGVNSYTVVVDDVDWSTSGYPSIPSAAAVQVGPWSGAVGPSGFTAAYRLANTTSARLVVSTNSGLTSPVYGSAVAPDSDGIVQLPVTGLAANTAYFFGVEADGLLLSAGRGEVKTFPAAGSQASFSLWFGSCQFNTPSDSTYAAILARSGPYGRALFGAHMGDMHYLDPDGTTTAAQLLTQYMTSLGSASMAPTVAKIPLSYEVDNHDWGGDTSDRTAAAGDLVAAQWRRLFPTYPLPATNGRGMYFTWVVGRVRFIQLDVRSYRDPQATSNSPAKTMLGVEQKAWFKAQLAAAELVKIVCGNYPWRDDGGGSGRWGSYPNEFDELSTYMAATAPGRVYVIAGDRHYLWADDGTSTGTRGIPQAGGAPIQQSSTTPTDTWSQGTYTLGGPTMQAYGWLDVTDAGSSITIDYKGITSLDGVTRVSMTTVIPLTVDAAASLSAGSSLTAAATRVAPATAALSAGSSLAGGGTQVASAEATLSGVGGVSAGAVVVQPAAATLEGVSDFDADAVTVVDVSAGLSATALLLADATVTAGEEAGVALPAWAPTVAQVADHIPYMTVDVVTPGSQAYLGTFSVATSPTDVQASRLIEGAWPPVAAALGLVAEAVYPLAQHVTALRAAAAIVRAFPRDDGDLAKAAALDARADADMLRLIAANDAAGGGAGSEPVLYPVYAFPPAPAWGDWLL
ncbi:alkaline phosphatase D family protein [Micromonospora sp. NPDC049081]|uniref:alkaline phosphatase D family protein n=1 Tax=Micromonospora sp. NPDC049081 TaxID=3155150 RepID=UPI0033F1ED83